VVEPAEVFDDGELGLEARREDAVADEFGLERGEASVMNGRRVRPAK
jgi:hypothetical protein